MSVVAPPLNSVHSRLDGQHAVITGGGRGIGAAIAQQLARAGARLTLVGRTMKHLEDTARTLGATPVSVDVTDENSVAKAFATFGQFEILVNCAGAAKSAPFVHTDRALWDSMISVNLTSVYLCCRASIGGMLDRNYGRIVNVASMAGLEPYRYVSGYVASKHGAIGLTRALALETADTGITVNAVCPGYTDTEMFRESIQNVSAKTGRSHDDATRALLKGNRQAHVIHPDEVARVVLWLCSPETVSVTGESIVISGGKVAA